MGNVNEINNKSVVSSESYKANTRRNKYFPKRIFLVRHGERFLILEAIFFKVNNFVFKTDVVLETLTKKPIV